MPWERGALYPYLGSCIPGTAQHSAGTAVLPLLSSTDLFLRTCAADRSIPELWSPGFVRKSLESPQIVALTFLGARSEEALAGAWHITEHNWSWWSFQGGAQSTCSSPYLNVPTTAKWAVKCWVWVKIWLNAAFVAKGPSADFKYSTIMFPQCHNKEICIYSCHIHLTVTKQCCFNLYN